MGKRSHSNKSETSEDEAKKVKLDDSKKVSKRKHKHKEKHKKRHKKEKKRKTKAGKRCETTSDAGDASLNDDRLLSDRAKAMAPMTKEEWEKRQSVVRRVFDEETGRTRLVKGDGEILEEIVSKQEHSRINKMATKNDGQYFQKNLISKLK